MKPVYFYFLALTMALTIEYSGAVKASPANHPEISKIKYLEAAFFCDSTGAIDLNKITAINYQIDQTSGGRIGDRLGGARAQFKYPIKTDKNQLVLIKSTGEKLVMGELASVPKCTHDEMGYDSGFTGVALSKSVEMTEYYLPNYTSCKEYSSATGGGWLRTDELSVTIKEKPKGWGFYTQWQDPLFFHSEKECLTSH